MDVIFDLDGTLANIGHRLHFIQNSHKPEWDAFFDACLDDKPIAQVVDVAHALSTANHRLIFATGRVERVRYKTEHWLIERCQLASGPLYMRADGDYRADEIVKQELLQRMLADGYRPTLAFDDRNTVVKMWRDNGVVCAQVADGNY